VHTARLLTLTGALWAWPLAAQIDPGVQDFLARARMAAGRFPDPAAAAAAGYRAVGPELPAMGQHWVQVALLIGGRVDPANPQILEYASIGDRKVLVGVAYAILVGPGGSAPDGSLPRRLWHIHGGDLDEESLSHGHAGSGTSDSGGVAVLHAWVPVSNPAGPFAAENWALPFLRIGLTPPVELPAAGARALALGTGALPYFLAQFRSHARPDSIAETTAATLFAAYADSIANWRARRGDASTLAPAELAWLAGLWERLEARLSNVSSRMSHAGSKE
jgi:hypothetical protein